MLIFSCSLYTGMMTDVFVMINLYYRTLYCVLINKGQNVQVSDTTGDAMNIIADLIKIFLNKGAIKISCRIPNHFWIWRNMFNDVTSQTNKWSFADMYSMNDGRSASDVTIFANRWTACNYYVASDKSIIIYWSIVMNYRVW